MLDPDGARACVEALTAMSCREFADEDPGTSMLRVFVSIFELPNGLTLELLCTSRLLSG